MNKSGQVFGPPVQREALAEQVARRILNSIQAHALRPGERLPSERELAVMLGVSRPSLREALRALALLGVVVKRQGEGVFVSDLDPRHLLAPLHFFVSLQPHHLDSLFEARRVIEAGVVELAARQLSDDAIERLQYCVSRGSENLDEPAEFLKVDLEFHRIIFDAIDNPFLNTVAESLHILGEASRKLTAQVPTIRAQSHDDHKKILEALASRDPARAKEAMLNHLRNVREGYQRYQDRVESDGHE